MAYDTVLAQRTREALNNIPGLTEKKMFGGIGFLVQGNMACGVTGTDLIVRISPEIYDTAIAQPFVRVFDLTGRPMKGWIVVEPDGVRAADDLKRWVQQGITFAQSLPPK